jgi:hypothetical protein
MRASGTFNSLGRGVLSPTGCNDARKFSCPNGTGAQGNTVVNTGGRDVKNIYILPCYTEVAHLSALLRQSSRSYM